MKMYIKVITIIVAAGLFLSGCSASTGQEEEKKAIGQKKEIIVSAAASLKKVLVEIEKSYEAENKDIDLIFNYGSSGSLQKQIEQGAPADLFFSAGQTQMDALEEKSLLISGTRTDVVDNDLVLIVGKDDKSIGSIKELSKAERICIGTPESVPVGKYAQEVLKSQGLWDSLQPKLVLAKDASQVLTYVESGNVEAGIVYKSDVHYSGKARIVETAPADSHSPIIYPAAVITGAKYPTETKDFLTYLKGSDAQAKFTDYGFKSIKQKS